MTFRSLRLALPLAAAFALAAVAAAEDTLPPGVIARVYGKDIRESDLHDRLVRRWRETERGRQVLDQLVDDICVDQEAARRSVTVTRDEVAAYVKRVDDTIRKQTGNARTIEDVYRDQHASAEEFAASVSEYLKRQKMAAEDLGNKPGEEVTEARLKLWLSSIRRRSGVRLTDLPEGALAMVGTTSVDRVRYAKALAEHLPSEAVVAARADLVLEVATERALAEANITVTDADVDADIAKLRERFADDPRVKGTGLTFDEFLRQNRGTTEADLKKDARFRASIGLERLLLRNITPEMVRKHWEENRDAFGERALVRQIYIAAQEGGGTFEMRSFADAEKLALRAKVAILERTGGLGTEPAGGRRPMPEAFAAVAKQFEEDDKKRDAAGEPIAWTKVSVRDEKALGDVVFSGATGVLAGPVRSRVGYHLVYVEERRPAPAFDEVKDTVKEDLFRIEAGRFQLAIKADPNVIVSAK